MKINKELEELQNASIQELYEKVDNFRRMRFSLELNSATAHIKDYSQFSKLRKNIARVLTLIRQRELRAE